jgi:hypothetical protein
MTAGWSRSEEQLAPSDADSDFRELMFATEAKVDRGSRKLCDHIRDGEGAVLVTMNRHLVSSSKVLQIPSTFPRALGRLD